MMLLLAQMQLLSKMFLAIVLLLAFLQKLLNEGKMEVRFGKK